MKRVLDITYGKCESKLDLYLPDDKVNAVFLYFHGGGLAAGDKIAAEIFAPFLTAQNIAVVSANYRMYSQNQYPDFLYDAAEATVWTYSYMQEHLSCNRLYIGGSSAGGYISMMLCFDCRYLASVGLDNSVVSGYLHDAGQPTAHFNILENRGIDSRRIIVDESAPLYYIGLEKSYPPMRFIVSDNDLRNRYEQTMLLLSTLSHFEYTGYDYIVMNGSHCEYVGKCDGNGQSVFGQMIADFINIIERNST